MPGGIPGHQSLCAHHWQYSHAPWPFPLPSACSDAAAVQLGAERAAAWQLTPLAHTSWEEQRDRAEQAPGEQRLLSHPFVIGWSEL